MYIYLNYYRMVCMRPSQIRVLDDIEVNAKTMQFINKSGKLITKHKATIGQWGVISVGITKF